MLVSGVAQRLWLLRAGNACSKLVPSFLANHPVGSISCCCWGAGGRPGAAGGVAEPGGARAARARGPGHRSGGVRRCCQGRGARCGICPAGNTELLLRVASLMIFLLVGWACAIPPFSIPPIGHLYKIAPSCLCCLQKRRWCTPCVTEAAYDPQCSSCCCADPAWMGSLPGSGQLRWLKVQMPGTAAVRGELGGLDYSGDTSCQGDTGEQKRPLIKRRPNSPDVSDCA